MKRRMLGVRDVVFIGPTEFGSSVNQQQQQQQQRQLISSTSDHCVPLISSTGLGIFPLLAATPCEPSDKVTTTKTTFNLCNPLSNGDSSMSMSMSMIVCRDCGNRAKKECDYKSCRTCCKARANYCSTHVRSTWVSASRRRDRHMFVVMDGSATATATATASASASASASSGSSSGAANKRPRLLLPSQTAASTSNATTTFETTSTHQDASFKKSLPGKVRAPAVFRCHRVTAISSGEGELAYQATVNIGGHIFKGFLYDQGLDSKNQIPSSSQLHLETGTHHKD